MSRSRRWTGRICRRLSVAGRPPGRSRGGRTLRLRFGLASRRNPQMLGQKQLDQLVERRLKLLAALGKVGFFAMPQRRDPGRLLNNDQMLIDIDELAHRLRWPAVQSRDPAA